MVETDAFSMQPQSNQKYFKCENWNAPKSFLMGHVNGYISSPLSMKKIAFE